MRATWVPAVLTPASPEHVSRGYRTAVTNLVEAPSDLAVAVLHAHGALETWHFRSIYGNAPGNIKAGAAYEGSYQCLPILNEREMRGGKLVTVWYSDTAELTAGKGSPPKPDTICPLPPGHPQSRFRAYATLASGIEDKIRFLATGKWREALQWALQGNPGAYVRAIKALGYFTADVEAYTRSVTQLTQKYLPVAVATREQAGPISLPPDPPELCRDIAACFRFELPPELAARIKIHQAEHIGDALSVVRADRDRDIQGGD